MGVTEALRAYAEYESLCPACKSAAKAAGTKIRNRCREGKHAKPKADPKFLAMGPPA